MRDGHCVGLSSTRRTWPIYSALEATFAVRYYSLDGQLSWNEGKTRQAPTTETLCVTTNYKFLLYCFVLPSCFSFRQLTFCFVFCKTPIPLQNLHRNNYYHFLYCSLFFHKNKHNQSQSSNGIQQLHGLKCNYLPIYQ